MTLDKDNFADSFFAECHRHSANPGNPVVPAGMVGFVARSNGGRWNQQWRINDS